MLHNKPHSPDQREATLHKDEKIHFGNLATLLSSRSRQAFPCMISVALPRNGWEDREVKLLPFDSKLVVPNVIPKVFSSFEQLVQYIHGNENGSYIYIVTSMDSTGKIQCATISTTQTITLELGDDSPERVNSKVDKIIPH